MEQKVGGVIAAAVFAIVGLFLFFNLRSREPAGVVPESGAQPLEGTRANSTGTLRSPGFREYPIGETKQQGMQIAAVWLPPVQMEGIDPLENADVIHLEADIHALEGNVNGFAKGEWMPYLSVNYEIEPSDSTQETIRGLLLPMVAKDGPHYGATIQMPGAGKYKLTYLIDNPSKNGFGRHSDPITGVAPWWHAFQVEFDFDYPGGKPALSTAEPK